MTVSRIPSYTFIVIDMQDYFSTSFNSKNIEACKQELRDAVICAAPIVLVEFIGCGRTASSIYDVVDSYRKLHIVRKNTNSGGDKISKYLINNNLPTNQIRLCGVNTDYCVLESVSKLTKLLEKPKIDIVAAACNSSYNHAYGMDRLQKMRHVNIV